MSTAICEQCKQDFDAAQTPSCPRCLAEAWLATPELIRPKHDPRLLPQRWASYRSVVSPDFASNPAPYLDYAARHGHWFWDRYYDMYIHFTHEPLERAGGSGIPMGETMPDHALDSLLIAEADSLEQAHVFAVAHEHFRAQIRAGEFVALARCSEASCDNLRIQARTHCVIHRRSSEEECKNVQARATGEE